MNHIDIASNHAGSMMGMTNCVGSICGFVAPSIVGLIVYTKVFKIQHLVSDIISLLFT